MHPLLPALRHGTAQLGLTLSDVELGQLLDYLDLLQRWGRVYNLTAVRDPRDMLTHHLLDSLAVVAPLRHQMDQMDQRSRGVGVRLLDVGSGAGLPGVVIAICCPEVSVSCIDSVAKKAAFVQQVAANLVLANLRGIHGRVENLDGSYGVVVARAFASLADFVRLSAKALAPDGIWMAMKGRSPDEEIAALPDRVQVFHVEQLEVPGLDARRCLVWMRPRPAN